MQNLRKRTFEVLEIDRQGDKLSRIIDILLISLISLNVLSVILETLPSLQTKYQSFFDYFEFFSVCIFSIEYFSRVWSSIENAEKDYAHPIWGRLRYIFSPMALIDLIVILPFYLGMFLTVDLRFMRVLRLLRVFKLTRYSSSMSLLLQVLADEAKSIVAALFILFMMIIMASSLIYLAEHEAQPEAFNSIPASMWWSIITITSIGYGDVVPITATGKILTSVIGVISIGIVALPAGLLASGFSEAVRQRRTHYENLVDDVLKDGVISSDEEKELEDTQKILGLSKDDANLILNSGRNKQVEKEIGTVVTGLEKEMKIALNNECPHCGKAVDWRHEKRKR